jgi:AraC family transcriptional activator of tynA and feaB
MPVQVFDMTTENHQYRRFQFRGENNCDFYDGELTCLSGLNVDMKIEKSVPGQYPIYKLTSRSGLTFRRSWSHIRNDKTNVTVFWFVRHGRIVITQAGKRHFINPHECTITRSSQPLFMELTPDESGCLEVLHIVVPTHKLYPIIGGNAELGKPIPASKGDISVTERMLTLLFESDADMAPDIAEQMAETLLAGLSTTVARYLGEAKPHLSIPQKRVSDIVHFIDQNFSNPDLSQKMVAERYGISLRYLCHLLKKCGYSFSGLVWERRMLAAREWLEEPKMQRYSITEIAYMAGFKSSAHFSRVFKEHHGTAPREYRTTHFARCAQARQNCNASDTGGVDFRNRNTARQWQ